MKWILINPRSEYLKNDASYPPTGLMHIGREIEDRGHEVQIIDMAGWNDERVPLADIYGITCVTPNVSAVQAITLKLPGDIPIIVGGVHPTFLPKETYEDICCSTVVSGEFEVVANEVISDAEKGVLKKFYKADKPCEVIKKPARHLVHLHRYTPGGRKCTPLYTSRGCVFDCNFCSKINGTRLMYKSLVKIRTEIEEIIDAGFDYVVVGDDNVGINDSRLTKLLQILEMYNIGFRLNRDVRVLNDWTFELAAKAGCDEVSFGFESGSQRILNAMNKRATVNDNKRAIEMTKKHGMKARGYLLVNFPGETINSIYETIDFINRAKPDSVLISNFSPLPGSDTFNNPKKYGITWISKDWNNFYLAGKYGIPYSFSTEHLDYDTQLSYHHTLEHEIEQILGE